MVCAFILNSGQIACKTVKSSLLLLKYSLLK